jgi:hypothetical protein
MVVDIVEGIDFVVIAKKLTRVAGPLLQCSLYFFFGGKISAVGFANRLGGLVNLPLHQGQFCCTGDPSPRWKKRGFGMTSSLLF